MAPDQAWAICIWAFRYTNTNISLLQNPASIPTPMIFPFRNFPIYQHQWYFPSGIFRYINTNDISLQIFPILMDISINIAIRRLSGPFLKYWTLKKSMKILEKKGPKPTKNTEPTPKKHENTGKRPKTFSGHDSAEWLFILPCRGPAPFSGSSAWYSWPCCRWT